MNNYNADSQIPNAPTHLYLLQMDSSIDLRSNEQVLPLHILDNSLEFGCKQYLLPIPTKQKDGQDQLQVLVDSSQGPAKIMGVIVDKNYQNIQNVLSVPECHTQLQTSSIAECSNIKQELTERDREFNVNKVSEIEESTQMIKKYVHISDRIVPPRALAVLPTVLQIQRRHIISTRRALPMRARFGPVQGIKRIISHSEAVELVLNATSNKKPLFMVKNMNDTITHIDVSDQDKSNWIGLLPLGDQNSANVWLYEENQELYVITTEIIPSRKALMIGYNKTYADVYGLLGPTKDIEKEPYVQKSWWCYECQHVLLSAKQLQSHMDLYHKEETIFSRRRRFRCRHCTRTFSRIFTLRRHTTFHCPVRLEKRNKVTSTEPDVEVPQINVNVSVCSEDNRIPSDESFQNYSNGLDFSINLFDTDRISSLDISGNSRSENDFNPYAIGCKDENGLTNDLDFSSKIENCQNPTKEIQPKPADHTQTPCPYCNQIVKGRKRLHLSKCPARLMKCECNKVFTNMKQFTKHIWTKHSNKSPTQNDNDNNVPAVNTNSQDSAQYKCEQCQHTFKRRGMLVNHLWRIHNTVSVRVPLERRVRHYPCGTCPKVYKTLAKRNRHVQLHHPGAAKVRGEAVESGTRVCEPAMCSACPRQYATRAKLLQHQRAHHPYLVPPRVNKKQLQNQNLVS